MIFTPVIVGVVALVALAVFFWKRNGIGSGRAFGNRIAAHLGIPRSLFHSLLDHGVKDSSRELLASLEKKGLSLDEASVALAPTLSRGVERLEAHFGPQETVDQTKPIVARLVALAGRQP
jgi:hypothetical protein